MKKHLITLLLTFCCTLCFAQSQSKEPEKVKPMMDTEIVRNISIIDNKQETKKYISLGKKANKSITQPKTLLAIKSVTP